MKPKHNHTASYSAGTAVNSRPPSPGIFLDALWRHPIIMLIAWGLALVGAWVYLDHKIPLYTGTARVYVEQEIPNVVGESEEGVMTRSENYLYTQAEVLRSTTVLANAVDLLKAEHLQLFADVNDPMSILSKRVKAQVGKMDGIINVSFKAANPQEAAEVVNAVIDAYVAFHSEQKREETTALLEILEEARVQRKAEMEEKYGQLLEFKQQNQGLAFGSDRDDNVMTRQMERLMERLSEARISVRQAKSLYDTAKGMVEDPVAMRQFMEGRLGRPADVAVATETASLREEMRGLETQKAAVLKELTPRHPAIAALDSSMKQVQDRIDQVNRQYAERQLAALEQEYANAKEIEAELEAQSEAQRQQVLALNQQQERYAFLQSEYEEAKRPSDVIENRIKELRVTEEVGGLMVTVLERAHAASKPSEPNTAVVLVVALLCGTFVGIGYAFVHDLWDQRLHSSQEISALLGLPVLAAIPTIRSPVRSKAMRDQMMRLSPNSFEAEAFRRLRTAFLFDPLAEKMRVILITSPAPGEGKSLVVSNLALALAQAGQRVVILDADCRTPRQHRIFKGDRSTKGLTAVLYDQLPLAQAIQSTGIANLDLLTCGPDLSNSTEMLNSDAFGRVVTSLAERYDRVLVDSPPVLLFTDAQVLAARCDATLLVLRAESSTRKASLQACGDLAGANAHVRGVVVNAVSRRHRHYHGAYHYSYSAPTARLRLEGASEDEPLIEARESDLVVAERD